MKREKKIIGIVGLAALMLTGGMATAAVDVGFVKRHEYSTGSLMDGSGILDQLRGRDGTCDTANAGNGGNGGNGNTGGNENGNGTRDGECNNFTNLTGLFTQEGIWFYLNTTRLYMGPYWFISFKESAYDYDGDGTTEMILQELLGLTGTTVAISGHLHNSNDGC